MSYDMSNPQIQSALAGVAADAMHPQAAIAAMQLGVFYYQQNRFDDAIRFFQRTTDLRPQDAIAWFHLGNLYRQKGQLDSALSAMRSAVAANPTLLEAQMNLGALLQMDAQIDEAIAIYRNALAMAPTDTGIHSNLVFATHYHPGYDAQKIFEEHRMWNERHAEPLKATWTPHSNSRDPERKLRIGYVSPNFFTHVVGYFIAPLFVHHDRANFDVYAYSAVERPDWMTEHLHANATVWRPINTLTPEQTAALIRQDQIDILVDLTMQGANNKLLVFARKPAPIQVTYLMYCSTTGLDAIDYRFSDPYIDPPETDLSVYSEKTMRLETYWCYTPNRYAPAVSPSPMISSDHVTFGSFNAFQKVSDDCLQLWAKILLAVPTSRLLLYAPQSPHRERAAKLLCDLGIDPRRFEFVPLVGADQYFARYDRIDIALDPFPYGGGTTTCDALWMGVPVVSLRGKTGVGRGGYSILSTIGLPELVAATQEEYVAIATILAGNRDKLENLRVTLRERMKSSLLMDAHRFARVAEASYREMWRGWCASSR